MDAVVSQHDLSIEALNRLVNCYHLCAALNARGRESVSSYEIGEHLGCGASVIRRDMAALGRLGNRGSGYPVGKLERAIGGILGKGRRWNMVLVGVGNLGAALLKHDVFERQGFCFVAAFDADPSKCGRRYGSLTVQDVSRIPEVFHELGAEIGVIAVPGTQAQTVAELLAESGTRAILNLSPLPLALEENVVVCNVDLTTELEKLCYHLLQASSGMP